MAYKVHWFDPHIILIMELYDTVALIEFFEIDKIISQHLTETEHNITLIIDASQAQLTPLGIEQIKGTQSFLDSKQIKYLLVVTDNRVTRLALLLMFNLCRPILKFFSNSEQLDAFLKSYIKYN
jgi:hypothetical protein